MKKIILIFSLLLAATALNYSYAQNTVAGQPVKSTEAAPAPLVDPAEMPSFPGGEQKLEQFIKDNLQYPKEALDNKKEGKVYVSFVVDETGKITQVGMEKRMAYGMDQEAMRVVKMMPNWTPAKQNGQPVAMKMVLPINFSLADTQKAK